jgi:small nuclear ribonucleoprotein (snRNP)-like protein
MDQQTKGKRSPSDFLKSVLGRPVRVKLNSGMEYRGKKEAYHVKQCLISIYL